MNKEDAEAIIALIFEAIPTLIVAFCCAWVLVGMSVEIAQACWRKFWRIWDARNALECAARPSSEAVAWAYEARDKSDWRPRVSRAKPIMNDEVRNVEPLGRFASPAETAKDAGGGGK